MTTTAHQLPFTPADVLAALRAGKAKDFGPEDYMAFNGAPEGSCYLDCFGDDYFVIVGAGFQCEVHGDEFAFYAHPDGHWMAA